LHFCFIVAEQYRGERLPMVVARHLRLQGHSVDVLEPAKAVTCWLRFSPAAPWKKRTR